MHVLNQNGIVKTYINRLLKTDRLGDILVKMFCTSKSDVPVWFFQMCYILYNDLLKDNAH